MLAITSRVSQLDRYIARVDGSDIPDDVRAILARHGAVLVCGFIERCVEVVIIERLQHRAHDRVLNFVRTHFRRGSNYDCEAICQLLERFDTEWARNFRRFVETNESVKAALSSMYSVRNGVAHGGDQSMGVQRLKELYQDAKRAVDALVAATA